MVLSFLAVLLICVLAALFGIRKVARLEPAIVFRG
jgi:ABC-type antimicrobial peptide transport system permease subunit